MKSVRLYLALSLALCVSSPIIAAPPKALTKSLPVHYKAIRKKRAGHYDISVRYPVFSGPSPVARFANDSLQTFARSSANRFIRQADKDYAEMGNLGPSNGYSLDLQAVISLARPDLISLYFTRDTYMGGAHPNQEYVSHTFGVVDGKAKRLALGDLFSKGKDPYTVLSLVAIPKLKERGASSITSGEIKRLSKSSLSAWVLTPGAITLLFEPYAVASYAEGPYEIKIPSHDMTSSWDTAGPVRGLLKALPKP